MVILQFNRLIRNKWIWGAFAIAISLFFAFDFLLTGDRGGGDGAGQAGKLAGENVTAAEFRAFADDVRGPGRNRDLNLTETEINTRAWRELAAWRVAEELHLKASDAEVREQIMRDPSFKGPQGGFNNAVYVRVLADNGFTPEGFEQFMRRRLTLAKVGRVVGEGAWVSPAELECAINDVTDKFTVRVATFDDKDHAKVQIDDAGIKAWYADNTNSIALPDCVTVRYLSFKADDPARLAKFKISEDEMRDHYDAVSSRFETTGTNGVTVTKKFEEVKGIVERELQLMASVEAYRTNMLFRVYPADVKAGEEMKDRFAEIVAAEKVKAKVSPLFALDGTMVAGFTTRPRTFAGDAGDAFVQAAAELDPESPDQRYGVVAGTNMVYVLERASFAKAHVPTFEEAKPIIKPRALADARVKAFKDAVAKKRALAAASLAKKLPFDAKTLAAVSVTTAMTFTAMASAGVADSRFVVPAVMKLAKGQLSEFIATGNPRRALIAYVEDRVPGDAASAEMMRSQMRDELSRFAGMALVADWQKWNLERLGCETTAVSSMVDANEVALPED